MKYIYLYIYFKKKIRQTREKKIIRSIFFHKKNREKIDLSLKKITFFKKNKYKGFYIKN